MKIAVTYSNGEVFQHFGKTEQFKVYEIEDNKVVCAEVIGNDGLGHEALAGLLKDKDIELLICGGMGEGAKNALAEAGVEVISGAEGDADGAVRAYLAGELESKGVTCDHHDHHEEGHSCHDQEEESCAAEAESCGGCGSDDEEGCGGCCGGDDSEGCGGCGGGCGGCGAPRIILEGKNAGKTVKVHYNGTLDDGSKFDSSYDRGEPLAFISGAGMMIEGFDKAVVDMEVGQKVNIHLEPGEAYGEYDEKRILNLKISELPGAENLALGDHVYLQNTMGGAFPVTVTALTTESITLDANHELAGKALNFEIELVSVED
ncbi:FKBP-type peptidyl-prolyl cis-trans isomerase [Butyrivibrio sp. MC2013]|uniref:FKBP-type peptidyl-prolyl cis-trans isomerase n=1 Tax=Butyrivibrio sp. MC2013 TaxID=1280686 RepID=UPI000402FE1F|nr:FKBP-type peptidyl-prolyl cis-trans isomerase [Butyrivibrio sp. MC2013]